MVGAKSQFPSSYLLIPPPPPFSSPHPLPLPYTLFPTPHTPHPLPYTPHPTPYTPHPLPYTPHPLPYTPHPTPLPMALKPDFRVGFSTGLKYWLFFMIGLFILGYDWVLSIFFGIVGAIAAGIVSAWWNPKEDDDEPVKVVEPNKPKEPKLPEPPPRKPHFQRYGVLGKNRPTKSVRRFGWLFRRK
ncbi:hypothetical protein K9N68_12675 [Kovacikia minuta CCNUW1]|uniref:hypothetical protein n=1 Tax=Kovacikia minuta TaxID=2931930 RepID=UPI001CC9D787|nr:hypothetical protein [Kovacikia minuta]UBF28650.1 hypothetical protein K9N68_12675 [Kovacikia minuta CCNUW1]